jgi:hypothetical protein
MVIVSAAMVVRTLWRVMSEDHREVVIAALWFAYGALWLAAWLRSPHPKGPRAIVREGPPPRWRRAPDPLPFGAWIFLAAISVWIFVLTWLLGSALVDLLGPWALLGIAAVVLIVFHLGERRRRSRSVRATGGRAGLATASTDGEEQ